MMKPMFSVNLVVDAEKMAELIVDYGNFLGPDGVRPFNTMQEQFVPAETPKKPKALRLKGSVMFRLGDVKNVPPAHGKADLIARQVALKLCAGSKSISRQELSKVMITAFLEKGLNPTGVSSATTNLHRSQFVVVSN